MTTLESLVPSLAVCQQLKAADFPQDTAFVWVNAPQGFISGGGLYMDKDGIHRTPETPSKGYANEVMLRTAVNTLHTVLCGAPTAGELEEWLMCHDIDDIHIANETADGENAVGMICVHSDGRDFEAHEATEIAAKAALVLEVMT